MIWEMQYVTHDQETEVQLIVYKAYDGNWLWTACEPLDGNEIECSYNIDPDLYPDDRSAREGADEWFRTVYLPQYRAESQRK